MRILAVMVALSATSAAADPLKVAIQDDEGKVTVVPLLEGREITIGRVEGDTIRFSGGKFEIPPDSAGSTRAGRQRTANRSTTDSVS